MSFAKRTLVSILVLSSIFIVFQTNNLQISQAANIWLSGSVNVELEHVAQDIDKTSPRLNCVRTAAWYPSYTNQNSQPATKERLVKTEDCINGQVGNYIHSNYAYTVKGSPGVRGIKNSGKILRTLSAPVNGAVGLGFSSSITSAGSFMPANTAYLVPTYHVNPPENTIKDDQGQLVYFNSSNYNFSQNGKYIIAEALGRGIVKIDTETYVVTLFSTEKYTYGMGYDPTPSLAISNDGDTAVVANPSGEINIYDIAGCTPRVIKSTNNTAEGCALPKNIKQNLQGAVPGFRAAFYVRFASNDKSIYAVAAGRDQATGVGNAFAVSINQAGYVRPKNNYLAMGDSFASGEGDMDDDWYEAGTNTADNKCHLSKRSYPYLISDVMRSSDFHSVACSGAKQIHLLNVIQQNKADKISWVPGWQPQQEYLENIAPAYITLSVGGNDVGFAAKLSECVLTGWQGKIPIPDTCKYADNEEARSQVAKEIALQYKELKNTYSQIIDKTDKKTKLYVVGYPQFVQGVGGNCANNVSLNDQERLFIKYGVEYMNKVIKAAATDAGATYLDIEDVLNGTNLCSSAKDKTVNGITAGEENGFGSLNIHAGLISINPQFGIGSESFHPNQNAQPLIRDRILQLTGNDPSGYSRCPDSKTAICPPVSVSKIPEPDSYFGQSAIDAVKVANGEKFAAPFLQKRYKQMVFEDEKLTETKFIIQDLKPNSTVRLEKHSVPVQLGTYSADSNGVLNVTLDLSSHQNDPGLHEIHAFVTNYADETEELYQPVFITGSEGDINGNSMPDLQEECGFVPDSGLDQDKDGVDDACDADLNTPIADKQGPVVSSNTNPEPDIDGWVLADSATVTFDCSDISGVQNCPDPIIVTEEGETTIQRTVLDGVGNATNVEVVVKLAKLFTPVLQPGQGLGGMKTPLNESVAGWGDLLPVSPAGQTVATTNSVGQVTSAAKRSALQSSSASTQNAQAPALQLEPATQLQAQLAKGAFNTNSTAQNTASTAPITAPKQNFAWVYLAAGMFVLFVGGSFLLLKYVRTND